MHPHALVPRRRSTKQMGKSLEDTDIPAQVKGYDAEVIGEEIMLYSIEKTEAVYLNPAASIVWALCDDKNTVADILGAITTHFSESTETELAGEVISALDELVERKVITIQ